MGYTILSCVLGIAFGVGVALLIMSSILHSSNNLGDSKAQMHSFAEGTIHGLRHEICRPSSALDGITNPVLLEKKKSNLSQRLNEKDEQEIDLAGFHIRVLFTPGHTPGSTTFIDIDAQSCQ